jgi:hypothetical protein
MALLVINISRVAQQVGVLSGTGKKETVRIMARSRANLAPGYTVDPRWAALNRGVISVIDETPPVKPAATQTAAVAKPATTTEVVKASAPVQVEVKAASATGETK